MHRRRHDHGVREEGRRLPSIWQGVRPGTLSIGRVAWTDHDTTQTDVIAAVKTALTAPPPKSCSGREVTVKRMDPNGLDGHGWGMWLEFMCGAAHVSIGSSHGSQSQSTVVYTVHAPRRLPRAHRQVQLAPRPHLRRFLRRHRRRSALLLPPPSGSVKAHHQRDPGDANHGWGMSLRFKCGDTEVTIGNSDQVEKTVFYDNVATGSCPSRVDSQLARRPRLRRLLRHRHGRLRRLRGSGPVPPPSAHPRRPLARLGHAPRIRVQQQGCPHRQLPRPVKSATTTFKLDGDDCPSRVDKSN